MKKIAVFPGSFDPFTKGHEDIARRGSLMFDELIIGIGHNMNKKRYFPLEVMQQKIAGIFNAQSNIKAAKYQGLTANFAREIGASFILRGLRNVKDFQYENSIAQINRHIFEELETVFILTSPEFAHINSSIVREIHSYGQNVCKFLPFDID